MELHEAYKRAKRLTDKQVARAAQVAPDLEELTRAQLMAIYEARVEVELYREMKRESSRRRRAPDSSETKLAKLLSEGSVEL